MTSRHVSSRRRLCVALGAAALGLAAAGSSSAAASRLAAIRERGQLRVGIYNDMPPFHANGRGIDVSLAEDLARRLGVALALMPFEADENMQDDLRNMVWRGNVLGYGPADMLIHVPVDAPLIDATPQVRFVAPYYREEVALAFDTARLPRLESLASLAGRKVAAAGQSLAGWLMIGADGGAYRETLQTAFGNGAEAARALQRGEVEAAAGNRSELESVVGADARFSIVALPSPRAPRNGWAVGCAVKRDAEDLALALQGAMNELAEDGSLAAAFAGAGVRWRRP